MTAKLSDVEEGNYTKIHIKLMLYVCNIKDELQYVRFFYATGVGSSWRLRATQAYNT